MDPAVYKNLEHFGSLNSLTFCTPAADKTKVSFLSQHGILRISCNVNDVFGDANGHGCSKDFPDAIPSSKQSVPVGYEGVAQPTAFGKKYAYSIQQKKSQARTAHPHDILPVTGVPTTIW